MLEFNHEKFSPVADKIFKAIKQNLRHYFYDNNFIKQKYTDQIPRLLSGDVFLSRLVRQITQKISREPDIHPVLIREFLVKRISEYFAYVDANNLLQSSAEKLPALSEIELANPLTTYHTLSRLGAGVDLHSLVSCLYFCDRESEMRVGGVLLTAQNVLALRSGSLINTAQARLKEYRGCSFELRGVQTYKKSNFHQVSFAPNIKVFVSAPSDFCTSDTKAVIRGDYDLRLTRKIASDILAILASENMISSYFGEQFIHAL